MPEIGSRMRYRIEEIGPGARARVVARFAEQAVAEVCIVRMAEAFESSTFILYSVNGLERQRCKALTGGAR